MKLALILPGNTVIQPPANITHTLPPVGSYGLGYVGVAVGLLMLLGAILAVIFLVYAGIKWITSEGDSKNIAGARHMIMYAIIGLAVIFFSYLAVNILSQFLGVNLLNPNPSAPGPCPIHGPC